MEIIEGEMGKARQLGGSKVSLNQDKWWLAPLESRFKIRPRVEHSPKKKAHKYTQRCLLNSILINPLHVV